MSFMSNVLLHLSLHEIINLFILDKKALRPIIYTILPGLITKNKVNEFCQQLINLDEKELLKKAVNQLYQIDHNINHYVNILKQDKHVFLYILPTYEMDNLLPTILKMTTDSQFIIQLLNYSMQCSLLGYLHDIVKIKTNDDILSNLIKDAQIILDLHI